MIRVLAVLLSSLFIASAGAKMSSLPAFGETCSAVLASAGLPVRGSTGLVVATGTTASEALVPVLLMGTTGPSPVRLAGLVGVLLSAVFLLGSVVAGRSQGISCRCFGEISGEQKLGRATGIRAVAIGLASGAVVAAPTPLHEGDRVVALAFPIVLGVGSLIRLMGRLRSQRLYVESLYRRRPGEVQR